MVVGAKLMVSTDRKPLISTYLIISVLKTKAVKSRIISGNIADTRFESLGLYHAQNIRYLQKPSVLPQQPLISTYLMILLYYGRAE